MNVDSAIKVGEMLVELGKRVFRLIAQGKPERVERILPVQLRTSLAKALADDDAEEHFARQRAMIAAGARGEGHE